MATKPDNMRIWSAVEKTDPAHTKGFQRAGGFRGTAIKPMWVWKRLTELFGPFGEGWGCDQPSFQLVPANDELLVYCTVQGWHGADGKTVWGVGGDKVITAAKNGPKADDEAFKKAFTDALMNAFKFIGVGADIHMGRFDDNKYVQELAKEFGQDRNVITDDQRTELIGLAQASNADMRAFCTYYKIGSLPELPASSFEHAKAALLKKLNEAKEAA